MVRSIDGSPFIYVLQMSAYLKINFIIIQLLQDYLNCVMRKPDFWASDTNWAVQPQMARGLYISN